MDKELLLGLLITTNKKCICNPTILLGKRFKKIFDIKNEVVPQGIMFDLNYAWELFLTKNIEFQKWEHTQDEVIDGISYNKGDITYTIKDNIGNLTKASFTLKNSQAIEPISDNFIDEIVI